MDNTFKTRKKRIQAAGSVCLPDHIQDRSKPYFMRSQINSSIQGELSAYNMMNLKIPNYQPKFDYFDLGDGKVIKKIGSNQNFEKVKIFGNVKSGKFLALYGNKDFGKIFTFLIKSNNGCWIKRIS